MTATTSHLLQGVKKQEALPASPRTSMSVAEKKRCENWLFAATVVSTLAGSFAMQAIDQVFLAHFAGDFAAHGRLQAWLSSSSSILNFLFQPLMGSLIDAYGRRWLLLASPTVQVLLKGGTAIAPPQLRVPLIVLQFCTGFFTFSGFGFARNAALGDIYAGDSAALGQALARLQIIWPLSSVVMVRSSSIQKATSDDAFVPPALTDSPPS